MNHVDLVITGEGAIDSSSIMGKGVGELVAACKRDNIPCIGLAGLMTTDKLFKKAYALTPDFVTLEEALTNAAKHLEALAAKAAKEL